jgi:3-mercaptopyruvate sulfurtransferase SseA/sterol desaturase/sphingolipid hydroxylase (fatty acid hydroxylase superfamily)
MKRFLSLFFGLVLISSTSFAQTTSSSIISADDLFQNFQDYVLIDISKDEKFLEDSIAGALHVTRNDISNTDADFGGLIASREKMEALMTTLGLSPADHIIVYDHKGGSDAGRLWWVLTHYGHETVQLLDGGIKAWGDRNSQIDSINTRQNTAEYTFSTSPTTEVRMVDLEEMKTAVDNPNVIIIDTRNQDEFEGKYQKDGAFKAGRIPSSIHIDWAANIDYHGDQLLLSEAELTQLYEGKGITKDKEIIVYCHSGVRSAFSAFVLSEVLKFPNVGNFDGSWIEWSYNKELAIDTGAVVLPVEEHVASYGEVFWDGFGNFASYTWNEITFQVSPWYVNYFWLLVVLSLVVWLLEIAFPWRKDQPIIRKDFWIDAFFMFFNFYIFKLIIFMSFSEVTAKFFHDLIGGDATSYALIDLGSLPLWAQLIIFFIATDFIQWFTHVLLHRFDFLWRFHKVHHSIEEMGFAGHLRYHWMENVFYTPMKYIAVMLIGGFTPEMAYIVFYISIAIGHINHANIGWDYGPFKYIFNNPKMHIWHHAKQLPKNRRYGVNFGISLSIWDYIFRKNYIPSNGRDIELGFDGIEKYPKGFFGLIFSGFRKTPDEK